MLDKTIRTFVVLDLETNNLPTYQFNKVSITELSLFAFSADIFHVDTESIPNKKFLDELNATAVALPELPRRLHKLTMMINPLRAIHPDAERVTGLSNEMLENESPFDKDTAECLNKFLGRLEGPVCFVAHNGINFDFPILRFVYDSIGMSLPSSIYCVDSFKAFREIDEKCDINKKFFANLKEENNEIPRSSGINQEQVANIEKENNETRSSSGIELDQVSNVEKENNEIPTSSGIEQEQVANIEKKNNELTPLTGIQEEQIAKIEKFVENSLINWQLKNETTPSRSKKTAEKRSYDTCGDTNVSMAESSSLKGTHSNKLNVRRTLFAGKFTPKTKYTRPGEYKLGNIYTRVFGLEPINAHRAEVDVEMLTRLILYYGLDFLAYAEERKELLSSLPKLGTRMDE